MLFVVLSVGFLENLFQLDSTIQYSLIYLRKIEIIKFPLLGFYTQRAVSSYFTLLYALYM